MDRICFKNGEYRLRTKATKIKPQRGLRIWLRVERPDPFTKKGTGTHRAPPHPPDPTASKHRARPRAHSHSLKNPPASSTLFLPSPYPVDDTVEQVQPCRRGLTTRTTPSRRSRRSARTLRAAADRSFASPLRAAACTSSSTPPPVARGIRPPRCPTRPPPRWRSRPRCQGASPSRPRPSQRAARPRSRRSPSPLYATLTRPRRCRTACTRRRIWPGCPRHARYGHCRAPRRTRRRRAATAHPACTRLPRNARRGPLRPPLRALPACRTSSAAGRTSSGPTYPTSTLGAARLCQCALRRVRAARSASSSSSLGGCISRARGAHTTATRSVRPWPPRECLSRFFCIARAPKTPEQ